LLYVLSASTLVSLAGLAPLTASSVTPTSISSMNLKASVSTNALKAHSQVAVIAKFVTLIVLSAQWILIRVLTAKTVSSLIRPPRLAMRLATQASTRTLTQGRAWSVMRGAQSATPTTILALNATLAGICMALLVGNRVLKCITGRTR